MAEQLPQFQDLAAMGVVPGIAGLARIAEEAAALVAREAADSGGGKYQFSPDELRAVLKQWQDLQHTITSARGSVPHRVPSSAPVMAPGNENASDTVAKAAHTTNLAYQEYLASMDKYVSGYVQKLSAALDSYLAAEHSNSGLAGSARNHLQA